MFFPRFACFACFARSAAAIRARTKLTVPDAFAVATAIDAEREGARDVRLETFDRDMLRAYRTAKSSQIAEA